MLRRVRFVAVLALTLIVVAGGTRLSLTKRDLLAAYADGVNADRAQAVGRLPIKYLIAGLTPTPWQPEDSLLIGACMAFDLMKASPTQPGEGLVVPSMRVVQVPAYTTIRDRQRATLWNKLHRLVGNAVFCEVVMAQAFDERCGLVTRVAIGTEGPDPTVIRGPRRGRIEGVGGQPTRPRIRSWASVFARALISFLTTGAITAVIGAGASGAQEYDRAERLPDQPLILRRICGPQMQRACRTCAVALIIVPASGTRRAER